MTPVALDEGETQRRRRTKRNKDERKRRCISNPKLIPNDTKLENPKNVLRGVLGLAPFILKPKTRFN